MTSQTKIKESVRGEIKALVLARLQTLNKDAKILLMGESITVRKLIDEVENDSVLGKKIVEVQFSFLQMLTRGEI